MVALVSTTVASAQENNQDKPKLSPEEYAQKKTERITKELSLTKEQQDKVYDLILQEQKEKAQIKEEMKALKAKRKAAFKKFDDGMKATLTSEQQLKYEEIKQKKKAKRKSGNTPREKK